LRTDGIASVASSESSGSGVVVLVERDSSDENELTLPQVVENTDDNDDEGANCCGPNASGFDFDRAFNRDAVE